MRRLRYNVAMSLDGCIADPDGGYDWIVADSTIDFAGLFAQFDLFVMGRKTYEVTRSQGAGNPLAGRDVLVVSTTLQPADAAGVTVIADGVEEQLAELKRRPGKDIWLFGGGQLFGHLLDADLVDTVEVAVIPVLLGGGIPLLPCGHRRQTLRLTGNQALPSGILLLTYAIETAGTGVQPE